MTDASDRPVQTVDCRGLACPMPIVRARKAMADIDVGQVLEVLATDKGAPADFKAWAEQTDQKFLGAEESDGHIRLRLKKLVPQTQGKGRQFPQEITNQELVERAGKDLAVLDVREREEFARGHIPGARHLPIESLEEELQSLPADREYAVVCRTGRRSDYACQILDRHGYRVRNVIPGMAEWTGPTQQH